MSACAEREEEEDSVEVELVVAGWSPARMSSISMASEAVWLLFSAAATVAVGGEL